MNKEIKVFNNEGESVGNYDVNPNIIVEKVNNHNMFLDVITEQAGRRQGTHSTLTKGEVRGGGKKPYRQKHTGNARQGSIRNPHYVGGGIAFGPKPNRNYRLSINKQVHNNALKSAYTQALNAEKIAGLVAELAFNDVSTKKAQGMLNKINPNARHILIILKDELKNINLLLSVRNMRNVTAKIWDKVSVRDLLANDQILIQTDAFDKVAEVLK